MMNSNVTDKAAVTLVGLLFAWVGCSTASLSRPSAAPPSSVAVKARSNPPEPWEQHLDALALRTKQPNRPVKRSCSLAAVETGAGYGALAYLALVGAGFYAARARAAPMYLYGAAIRGLPVPLVGALIGCAVGTVPAKKGD